MDIFEQLKDEHEQRESMRDFENSSMWVAVHYQNYIFCSQLCFKIIFVSNTKVHQLEYVLIFTSSRSKLARGDCCLKNYGV